MQPPGWEQERGGRGAARAASGVLWGGGQVFPWGGVGGSDWRPGWVGSSTFFPYSLGPPWTLCPVLGCGVARGTLLCPREMSSGFLDFGRNTGLSCNFKSWFLLRLKMQFCAGALIEAGPSVPRDSSPMLAFCLRACTLSGRASGLPSSLWARGSRQPGAGAEGLRGAVRGPGRWVRGQTRKLCLSGSCL